MSRKPKPKRKKKHHRSKKPLIPNRQAEKPLPSIEESTIESLLSSTGNWPEKILIDVGIQLHMNRKMTPIPEDEAPADATYDDRIGIHYAPLDIKTCGFRIQANPRRIGTTEVATYANRSCRKCHGLGKWHVTRTAPVGRDQAGNKILNDLEHEVTCQCAERQYKRTHKQFLIDSQLGEFIALDDLKITEAPPDDDDMPEMPRPEYEHQSVRPGSVPEVPYSSETDAGG